MNKILHLKLLGTFHMKYNGTCSRPGIGTATGAFNLAFAKPRLPPAPQPYRLPILAGQFRETGADESLGYSVFPGKNYYRKRFFFTRLIKKILQWNSNGLLWVRCGGL
jgi:hypothetical protein